MLFRSPLEEAARIALETAVKYLKENSEINLIRFVLFGKDALAIYEKVLTHINV